MLKKKIHKNLLIFNNTCTKICGNLILGIEQCSIGNSDAFKVATSKITQISNSTWFPLLDQKLFVGSC